MKKRASRKVVTRGGPSKKKAARAKAAPRAPKGKAAGRKSPRPPAVPPASVLHSAVVSGLKQWVSMLDDQAQNKPLVAAAIGRNQSVVITPRTLINHIERRTAIGERYFENIQQLAVAQVLKNFGGGGGSHGGSEGGLL